MNEIKQMKFNQGEQKRRYNFGKIKKFISDPRMKILFKTSVFLSDNLQTICMSKLKQKEFNLGVQK